MGVMTTLDLAPRLRLNATRVAYGAHAVHDGFTDCIYVLLPLFQAEFGLSYTQTGLMKALFSGALAGFQTPSARLAGVVGPRAVLAGGTALAAAGFLLAGASVGFPMLMLAILVMGLGTSVQHPIASDLVASEHEQGGSREALSRYNVSGDVGKVIFPSLVALMLGVMAWRTASTVVGVFGLVAAGAIALALAPGRLAPRPTAAADDGHGTGGWRSPAGFAALLGIGMIDSATRTGFLTFLPFLLTAKGAAASTIGVALSLVFAGGAFGKLACGLLAARIGPSPTVLLTETLTAALIVALPFLDVAPALALLPLLGVALNGTSSALYGTVPELAGPDRRRQAFAIFYTGTIGVGAVAPVFYGLFSDRMGLETSMILVGSVVLLTLPLAAVLSRLLGRAATTGDLRQRP